MDGYEPDELPKDINGVEIRLKARVAYGDWGHRVMTGTVKKFTDAGVMIDPDKVGWGLFRHVFGKNTEKMILVLGEEKQK